MGTGFHRMAGCCLLWV